MILFISCRKIATVVFFAAFSTTAAQSSTFDCIFSSNYFNEYICSLNGIEALNPNQNFTIGGVHEANRTNNDVEIVLIRNSSTPFMIQQIFSTFPNMNELDIQGCNLQSIDIPASAQLEWLTLSFNNISRIGTGNLRNQSQLQYFSAIRSGIHEIDENAFEDLHNLQMLVLMFNNISSIAPRTFNPLVSAFRIDYEGNNLTRLDSIFITNRNLTVLYFEYNQIIQVSPSLLANLNSLSSINLRGNQCIDRFFSFGDEPQVILYNNVMSNCFQNYLGRPAEARRITLEFRGPLALFDEFGNVVARIN